MSKVALTGHTRGLGLRILTALEDRGHQVQGFSKSTGCDLRDYSQVSAMIESIQKFDWFINCAHPDYCQAQILYRLIRSDFDGKILNVGSSVVHKMPPWTDLFLLEYSTQKTALWHAHQTLSLLYPEKTLIWEPQHTDDQNYVIQYLTGVGL